MPTATLLLRENNSGCSLTAIVEKSQLKRPPLPQYDIRLRSCELDLIPIRPANPNPKPSSSPDEGFESDADSLSIVSSDDSFVATTTPKTETDSANGSACSDSEDLEVPKDEKETHDLVRCLCYADVKFPDLLVFVIEANVLVFKFDRFEELEKFYVSFNTLKAVSNQKVYSDKFNLLQRVDNNGVTHIEVSREPKLSGFDLEYTSNIISLNTPENYIHEKILKKVNEDLVPKKPERRKKMKGKAPLPPSQNNTKSHENDDVNVLKGEYVRVNVPKVEVISNKLTETLMINPTKTQFITNQIFPKPKLTTYQQFKHITEKSPKIQQPIFNQYTSLPRSKTRSRSETRNFAPMAYRYIDTTNTMKKTSSPMYQRRSTPVFNVQPLPISNRLFGMSSKLKDFSAQDKMTEASRWSSLGELNAKDRLQQNQQLDTNLKSVIKKEEGRKKSANEKKVTFSAYATVQVV